MIYICDKCLKASCWLGLFMCWESRDAGLYRAHKRDVVRFALENPDYINDPEVIAPKSDKTTPIIPRSLVKEAIQATEVESQRVSRVPAE